MAKDIKKNVKEDYWQNTSHSARVKEYDDGTKQLYSYGTLIATIKPDGDVELTRYWNYSRTTGQHLRDFLRKYGIGNYGSSESIYNDLILKRKVEDDNIELRKMAALQNAIDELKYGKGDKDSCDWCGLSQNDFNEIWKQAKKEVREMQKQQKQNNVKKEAKYTQRPENKLLKEEKERFYVIHINSGIIDGEFDTYEEAEQFVEDDMGDNNYEIVSSYDYDDCVGLCADECPYCHSSNIESVDCDDESCKYVCYDCDNDFIVWDDGSITDRHNSPIEESCKKEEKLSMKVTREKKPIKEDVNEEKVVVHLLPDNQQEDYGYDYFYWVLDDDGLYGRDGKNGLIILDDRGGIYRQYTQFSDSDLLGAISDDKLSELIGKEYNSFGDGDFEAYYPVGEFSDEWLQYIADICNGYFTVYEVQNNDNYDYDTIIGNTVITTVSGKGDDEEQIAKQLGVSPSQIIIKKPVQRWDYEESLKKSSKKVVKESKKSNKGKALKESRKLNESYYVDIIDDLIDRAKDGIRSGEDIDDAVSYAIDGGLIYSADILELARHYDTLPDDSELLEGFYDDLYSEIYSEAEDYADEYREELLDELDDEADITLDDLGIENEDYYINGDYDADDIYNEIEYYLNNDYDSAVDDANAYVESFEFDVADDGSGNIHIYDIVWALNESLKSKKGKKAIKESKKSTKTKKAVKESKTNKNNKK